MTVFGGDAWVMVLSYLSALQIKPLQVGGERFRLLLRSRYYRSCLIKWPARGRILVAEDFEGAVLGIMGMFIEPSRTGEQKPAGLRIEMIIPESRLEDVARAACLKAAYRYAILNKISVIEIIGWVTMLRHLPLLAPATVMRKDGSHLWALDRFERHYHRRPTHLSYLMFAKFPHQNIRCS
jgi:hypothetical protein